MNTSNSIILLLSILLTINIFSQPVNDIVTDRPDQTESAITVPKGVFQIELGAEIESTELTYTTFFDPMNPVTDKVKTYTIPAFLLRYGLTKNIELRGGIDYFSQKFSVKSINSSFDGSTNGPGPLTAGIKINLMKEKDIIPETAFLFSLLLPIDKNSPFQSNNVDAELRFAMQNTLNEQTSLSYNLGAMWNGGGKEFREFLYTLSLAISLNKKLSVFAESYGFFEKEMLADHRLDGGFTYLFAKNIQADISGGIGLSTNSPDYFIGAGLSFRLPK